MTPLLTERMTKPVGRAPQAVKVRSLRLTAREPGSCRRGRGREGAGMIRLTRDTGNHLAKPTTNRIHRSSHREDGTNAQSNSSSTGLCWLLLWCEIPYVLRNVIIRNVFCVHFLGRHPFLILRSIKAAMTESGTISTLSRTHGPTWPASSALTAPQTGYPVIC